MFNATEVEQIAKRKKRAIEHLHGRLTMRILALLLLSLPTWGAVAYVGGAIGDVAASGTLSYSATAGNTLIVSTAVYSNTQPTISCAGATCTFDESAVQKNSTTDFLHSVRVRSLPTGVTGITITGAGARVVILEFSGTDTGASAYGFSGSSTGWGTGIATPTVTTADAVETVLVAIEAAHRGNAGGYGTPVSWSNSFTKTGEVDAPGNYTSALSAAYRIVSTAAAYNTTATFTADNSVVASQIVGIKVASAPATTTVRRRIIY